MSTNPVVHFEIPADDYERAKKFYEELFGWKIEEWTGTVKYGMATTTPTDKNGPKEPGAINGAIMEKTKDATTTVITIAVPSIDDYMDKIVKAGGKMLKEKVKVGDMGYNAIFSDSEGNTVGLWENLKS